PTALYPLSLHDALPIWKLNPKAPPELETIALKALDKEPSRRYPDAGSLAEDLRRYLEGEPIEAQLLPRPVRIWRTIKKHRTILIDRKSTRLNSSHSQIS